MLADAAPGPGSLIVLPETFASGFTGDVAAGTDSPGDETAAWCCDIASRYDCTIIAGLITTADDGRGRNQAIVCTPVGEAGRYTKIHRFTLGGEADQFAPGDRPHVFELDFAGGVTANVAPLVCYDLRFPETFREAAQEGVDVFVVIANWPSQREHHWHALLRARAIENQAFVVGVNRTGSDPNIVYSGGTSVYNPDGQALLSMDELPGVAATTLDLAAMRETRRRLPFLADFLESRSVEALP
jgi:predicted amidohydrolase